MSEQNSTEPNDLQVAASTTPSKQQEKTTTGDSNVYKESEEDVIKLKGTTESEKKQVELQGQFPDDHVVEKEENDDDINSDATPEDISGRERLKRHRKEVAGQVWIPEKWGKEEFLEDWIDCSAFNASLVPTGIISARAALIDEGPRAKFRWN
ncbi:protein BIC1-like [Telopea speciosissima]|uniref:protein BIC1-like n=1 Tax=Telopea speciosissima TaxID=54955 RepID=UPI001CC744F9|nr:protein BIC1-like [Telopea speciosissima]